MNANERKNSGTGVKKIALDPEGLRIDWTMIGQSIVQYCAWHRQSISPVGFAWVVRYNDGRGIRADVLHVAVQEYYRRQGIATKLLAEVAGYCDVMTTTWGSATGGRKLLLALGWRHDRTRCLWSKIIRNPKSKT